MNKHLFKVFWVIQLVVNWILIGSQLASHKTLNGCCLIIYEQTPVQTFLGDSIGSRLDFNWNQLVTQKTLNGCCLIIYEEALVVNWHTISSQLAHLHWGTPDLINKKNLAKIEASDWWRAQNAGFSLVERSHRKFSKGVPLRYCSCVNWMILTSIDTRLVHVRLDVSQFTFD